MRPNLTHGVTHKKVISCRGVNMMKNSSLQRRDVNENIDFMEECMI